MRHSQRIGKLRAFQIGGKITSDELCKQCNPYKAGVPRYSKACSTHSHLMLNGCLKAPALFPLQP
eukprot:scaffold95131_cov14-Tisochrysis_lutea.AAC.1